MDTLKCCICEDYLKNIMFGFMKQFQFLIVHQEWLKTLGWKRDANNTHNLNISVSLSQHHLKLHVRNLNST